MAAYQLSLVGLFLDIIGVFLLAVEAIKLPNLRRLRDKVFVPLHHSLLPAKLEMSRSERRNRRWGYKADWIVIEPYERRQFHRSFRHFYLSHYLGGMFGLIVIAIMFQVFGLNILGIISNSLSAKSIALIAGFHILVTVLGLAAADSSAEVFPMTVLPFFVLAAMMTYPPTLVCMALGELLHMGSIKSSKAIVSALNYIDSKTPDGTIGIIGFLLAFAGFVFQFIGTWAGVNAATP